MEEVRRLLVICVLALGIVVCNGQETGTNVPYRLTRVNDSLYYLNEWSLPYPVYQFQTGDVDGDGREDAIVGVIKATRFYPEKARRVFIFKQVKGKVRPLWMGSRLGGNLEDFRFRHSSVISLETGGRRESPHTSSRRDDKDPKTAPPLTGREVAAQPATPPSEDFRETSYAVVEYQWEKFGLEFQRFLAKNVSEEEARRIFDEATSGNGDSHVIE